jgi:hypothetical protein
MKFSLAAALAALCMAQNMPEPALPYVDTKACPFEGCVYREWTAQAPADIYDTWRTPRNKVAAIGKGEKVTGLNGVVVTFKPGVIRLDRDFPEQRLSRGDIVLTYTNQGEGFSSVWFQGRFDPSFDISFAKWPDGSGCGGAHCAATYVDLGQKEWWAQVRLPSGKTGWVDMDHSSFNGVDLLALL